MDLAVGKIFHNLNQARGPFHRHLVGCLGRSETGENKGFGQGEWRADMPHQLGLTHHHLIRFDRHNRTHPHCVAGLSLQLNRQESVPGIHVVAIHPGKDSVSPHDQVCIPVAFQISEGQGAMPRVVG